MIQLSADRYEFATTQDRQRLTSDGKFAGYIKATEPPDDSGWVLLKWRIVEEGGETLSHCLWARTKDGK